VEVFKDIDRVLRLFHKLIKIPLCIMVFSRVYYLPRVREFQVLFRWQCSLCSYLFRIECKLARMLTDPVGDVNTTVAVDQI
jgi:hypothetical protein